MTTHYKSLPADRQFMTGYSTYCEGWEYEMDFADTFAPLDAPHWIPGGSTKHSVGGSFIVSSFWVSLSYNRIA